MLLISYYNGRKRWCNFVNQYWMSIAHGEELNGSASISDILALLCLMWKSQDTQAILNVPVTWMSITCNTSIDLLGQLIVLCSDFNWDILSGAICLLWKYNEIIKCRKWHFFDKVSGICYCITFHFFNRKICLYYLWKYHSQYSSILTICYMLYVIWHNIFVYQSTERRRIKATGPSEVSNLPPLIQEDLSFPSYYWGVQAFCPCKVWPCEGCWGHLLYEILMRSLH